MPGIIRIRHLGMQPAFMQVAFKMLTAALGSIGVILPVDVCGFHALGNGKRPVSGSTGSSGRILFQQLPEYLVY